MKKPIKPEPIEPYRRSWKDFLLGEVWGDENANARHQLLEVREALVALFAAPETVKEALAQYSAFYNTLSFDDKYRIQKLDCEQRLPSPDVLEFLLGEVFDAANQLEAWPPHYTLEKIGGKKGKSITAPPSVLSKLLGVKDFLKDDCVDFHIPVLEEIKEEPCPEQITCDNPSDADLPIIFAEDELYPYAEALYFLGRVHDEAAKFCNALEKLHPEIKRSR